MTAPPRKPTIPEVVPLIRAYYELPGNDLGGSLHVVLEDGNVDLSMVELCGADALDRGDVEGAALARVLALMSVTQRRKLSRVGFYSWGGGVEVGTSAQAEGEGSIPLLPQLLSLLVEVEGVTVRTSG